MGRKSLHNQALHVLNSKMALGKSRKQAKDDLRAQLGSDYRFGAATEGIHSIKTRQTYQAIIERFVSWCQNEQGVGKYASLAQCKPLAPLYLQARKEQGKSVWTLKTERAALGKLFGRPVAFAVEARTPNKITRSRHRVEMDRHFSAENNRDLITIARGTGGRREDLEKMKVEHFRQVGGRWYVDIYGSKGGKDRTAPIRPDLEREVMEVVDRARVAGKGRLFERINCKCDIHAFRREYARKLYRIASRNKRLRDELASIYPPRCEPHIKSNTYTTRRYKKNRTFRRDDLYLVSQALGHERLEVVVTHYLL